MKISFEPWTGFTVRIRGRVAIYETDDEAIEAIADHVDDPEAAVQAARDEFFES